MEEHRADNKFSVLQTEAQREQKNITKPGKNRATNTEKEAGWD